MENRKLTQVERKEIIKMMESAGWHYDPTEDDNINDILTGLFFTIPLNETDKNNAIEGLKPNHFKPLGYRSVSIFNNYITSHIRGSYRRFRSRNWYNDKDTFYPGLFPTYELTRNGKKLTEYSPLQALRQYNNFWGHW